MPTLDFTTYAQRPMFLYRTMSTSKISTSLRSSATHLRHIPSLPRRLPHFLRFSCIIYAVFQAKTEHIRCTIDPLL
jgi:hypothetical protein